MREIKFKALDKNKYWVHGLPYYEHGTGIWYITHSNGWQPTYNNPDEGEYTIRTEIDVKTLTQFTGLKDKNGVDIYEGDKLKIGKYKTEFIVKYNQASFTVYTASDEIYCTILCDSNATQYEVIGNIYENPKLLEEKL